jgi:hypothetical protein
MLMHKLGLLNKTSEPDAEAVHQYGQLCTIGLSDSNVEAIDELFPDCYPEDDEEEVEPGEWA